MTDMVSSELLDRRGSEDRVRLSSWGESSISWGKVGPDSYLLYTYGDYLSHVSNVTCGFQV